MSGFSLTQDMEFQTPKTLSGTPCEKILLPLGPKIQQLKIENITNYKNIEIRNIELWVKLIIMQSI